MAPLVCLPVVHPSMMLGLGLWNHGCKAAITRQLARLVALHDQRLTGKEREDHGLCEAWWSSRLGRTDIDPGQIQLRARVRLILKGQDAGTGNAVGALAHLATIDPAHAYAALIFPVALSSCSCGRPCAAISQSLRWCRHARRCSLPRCRRRSGHCRHVSRPRLGDCRNCRPDWTDGCPISLAGT